MWHNGQVEETITDIMPVVGEDSKGEWTLQGEYLVSHAWNSGIFPWECITIFVCINSVVGSDVVRGVAKRHSCSLC